MLTCSQHSNGVSHELRGEFQNLWRHGCREEAYLDVRRQRLEDVVDLILKATRQHHVSLITDKREQVVNAQVTLAQHVEHAAWCADHNVLSVAKLVDVVTHRRSANARMVTHVEVVAKCQHHLVDLLASVRGSAPDTHSNCSQFAAKIR